MTYDYAKNVVVSSEFRERLVVFYPDTNEREVLVRYLVGEEGEGLQTDLNVAKAQYQEFFTFHTNNSIVQGKIDDVILHVIEPNPEYMTEDDYIATKKKLEKYSREQEEKQKAERKMLEDTKSKMTEDQQEAVNDLNNDDYL